MTTADGTDITEEITSTDASSSNSYYIGTYNLNSKYQYTAAGEILTATVNTSSASETGYNLPIVQASSSSSVATTNIYVQLKGIQISNNQVNWIDVNESTTMLNGTSWGKYDLDYGWFEDITDDPTTLTLSSTGNTTS